MRLPDLLNQPWAITRGKFDSICEVYDRRMAGLQLDEAGIRAAIGGAPKPATPPSYTVQNGVAVIPVEGVLAKKMNLMTAISGGMSTEMLVDTVNEALADDSVVALMLSVDSPGGEVDGTMQLASVIANATKPTAAWVDGLCASAALWIASQCDAVYAASDTSQIGSLGVLFKHTDYSKKDSADGRAVTHITTGKYKAAGNSSNPLSQDDRAYLQGNVDYIYTLFLNAVAAGREMDPQALDETAGDAEMFFAQQAIDNGLIDGIASEAEVISRLSTAASTRPSVAASAAPARTPSAPQPRTGASAMSAFKTFATEAEYNAAIEAAKTEARAELPPNVAAMNKANENASRIRGHIAKVKTQEGRTINVIEAMSELQAQGGLLA